ncbi:MAG: phosphoribosyltransferase, partial [Chloroflexota bacterium]
YRDANPLILAIPRGGVEVAYQVAERLDADFSLLVVRKLPYPDQPEAGFGAVAEDGSSVVLEKASRWVSDQTVRTVMERQRQEIERRVAVLRKGRSLPELEGRTVILVDDGIATGATMQAAVRLCVRQDARKIIVAVPVAGSDVEKRISSGEDGAVDKVVVLEQPEFFRAVAQVYETWYDVPDSEVTALMERWEREHAASR